MKVHVTLFILMLFSVSTYSQVHIIKETIHFDFNKTKLTQNHRQKLDSVYNLIEISSDYNADIKGYTDNVGSRSVNMLVSKLRALSVYNYLVDKGASKDRLTYAGFAWDNPMGSNKTRAGRALNRRADLEVLIDMTVGPVQDKDSDKEKENDIVLPPPPPPPPPIKSVDLGPDMVSGNIPVKGNKNIHSTNGVKIVINQNSLVTYSDEPIEFDFKDFTDNYSVIDRKIQTTGKSCGPMALHGAFSLGLIQDYQDLSINRLDPVKVLIPREYNENVKLYNNPRNWQLDTMNELTYNDAESAYELTIYDQNNIFGLLEERTDTLPKFIKIKVKGAKPDLVKPYLMYDDCSVSNGCNCCGRSFVFPIVKESGSYKVRAMYTDFNSKTGPSYSLIEDLGDIEDTDMYKKVEKDTYIEYVKKKPVSFINEKMKYSDLCKEETE